MKITTSLMKENLSHFEIGFIVIIGALLVLSAIEDILFALNVNDKSSIKVNVIKYFEISLVIYLISFIYFITSGTDVIILYFKEFVLLDLLRKLVSLMILTSLRKVLGFVSFMKLTIIHYLVLVLSLILIGFELSVFIEIMLKVKGVVS